MEESIKSGEDLVKRDENGRVVSGVLNPNGRPKGQSMKEFWKQRIAFMTPEEKAEFSRQIDKLDIWKMAEGQAKQSLDGGEDSDGNPLPILGGLTQKKDVSTNNSPPQDTQPNETP